jgi:hypothetical protein
LLWSTKTQNYYTISISLYHHEMKPFEPHTDPDLPTQTPQPLRTSSLHGSALCTLGVVVRFPSLPTSRVSVAGAPPAASMFGGVECGKKAGSSPSNGVAATSPWRVLSSETRWNRQSAFQPLGKTWSSTLRCQSCPIWSRAALREFSSVRPAGLGLGLGGTMLESIRVTGECRHCWPKWRGCSGWRPLGLGLGRPGAVAQP